MNRRSSGQFFCARSLIWAVLLLTLVFNFTIRWRLRDMPLERDEGEYAYAGQLILQGIPPYQLAYNMKFPGVYFAYGILMAIFGETSQGIHIGMIFITSATTVLVFLIGCELLGRSGGVMAAATFVCLSALPMAYGLASHATHFVALFVCAGTLTLLKAETKMSLFWSMTSGAAFGIAILMKQHAVFFPVLGMAWIMGRMFQPAIPSRRKLKLVSAYSAGCVIPLLMAAVGLACAGVWSRFYFWTIQYAREYVSIFPLGSVWRQFALGFQPVLESSLWVWLFGAAAVVLSLVQKKWERPVVLSGLLFLTGMLAACPGFYFRGHYFLLAAPGLALLNAAAVLAFRDVLTDISQVRWIKAAPACLFCLALAGLVAKNCEIWFRLTPCEISRRLYGASPFPESLEVAGYLKQHTSPDDTIAVLGSEPQIFFLARRHSASGYIYLYSLTEPQRLTIKMQREFTHEIETSRPKYVVWVDIMSSWFSTIIPGDPSSPVNSILNWWNDYSHNYQLVGAVDVFDEKPSEFFWDEQLTNRTNPPPCGIRVYRKRQ